MDVIKTSYISQSVFYATTYSIGSTGIVYDLTTEFSPTIGHTPNSTNIFCEYHVNHENYYNGPIVISPDLSTFTYPGEGSLIVVPAEEIDNLFPYNTMNYWNFSFEIGGGGQLSELCVPGEKFTTVVAHPVTGGELLSNPSSLPTGLIKKNYYFYYALDWTYLLAVEYTYGDSGDFRKISYPLIYTQINTEQIQTTTYTYRYELIASTVSYQYNRYISNDFNDPYNYHGIGVCANTNTVYFVDCKYANYSNDEWYTLSDGNCLVIKKLPSLVTSIDYGFHDATFSQSMISSWENDIAKPLYVVIQWVENMNINYECIGKYFVDSNGDFVMHNGITVTPIVGETYIFRLFEYSSTSYSDLTPDDYRWLKKDGTNTLAYTESIKYGYGNSEDDCENACYVNTPGLYYGRYYYYTAAGTNGHWVERTYVPYIWRNCEPFYVKSLAPSTYTTFTTLTIYYSGSSTNELYELACVDVDEISGYKNYEVKDVDSNNDADIVLLPNHKYYLFRCDTNTNMNFRFTDSGSTTNYNLCYEIGGCLTSLCNHKDGGVMESNNTVTTNAIYNYFTTSQAQFWVNQKVNGLGNGLFQGCKRLYSAKRLEFPFYIESYYAMFGGCGNLVEPPIELPALYPCKSDGTPISEAYRDMFIETPITKTPIIYFITPYIGNNNGETMLMTFAYCNWLEDVYLKMAHYTTTDTNNVIGFNATTVTSGDIYDLHGCLNDAFRAAGSHNNSINIYKLPYAKCESSPGVYSSNFSGFLGWPATSTNFTVSTHDITDNSNNTSVTLSNVKRN